MRENKNSQRILKCVIFVGGAKKCQPKSKFYQILFLPIYGHFLSEKIINLINNYIRILEYFFFTVD